jgi:hypothetical protein
VAELLLDHVRGDAFRDQFGGVGVAQAVRVDALLDAGALGGPGDREADVARVERLALEGAEQRRSASEAELLALVEPAVEIAAGFGADRDDAVVVALPWRTWTVQRLWSTSGAAPHDLAVPVRPLAPRRETGVGDRWRAARHRLPPWRGVVRVAA